MIQGEDGGLPSNLLFGGQQGWSYQTALDKIEESHGLSSQNAPPRMDIASLIAAKRKSLKKGIHDKDATKVEVQEEEEESDKADQDEAEDAVTSDGDENEDENDEGIDDGSTSEDADSDDDKDEEDSEGSDDDDDENDEVDDANHEMAEDVLKTRIGDEEEDEEEEDEEEEDEDDTSDKDEEAQREAEKASKYFETQAAPKSSDDDVEVFAQLTLSRPLLRGIAAMGYVKPTAIQSSVIPVALAGRDICASAVTGSGKTAAFLLPILERLLYRSPGRIKALILTPTRELAAQCLGMMATLSQFTKLSSTLIVGGSKNMNAQMAELRARPQVVVATPGRLLDHITNSAGVSLEDVEFLVLDEADRLLDLGFADEVNEIIKACPLERQTLLFSATMNTKVDDLIKLSLKRPVRVRISDKQSSHNSKDLEVAPRLEQEFIRVRSGNEGVCREAMLLALLTRTFATQTIVFFDTKVKAHRMMILCGLCGIQCTELHGNLTQGQRLEALEQFRKGEVDILLATDLAARGLDISRVGAVINFEMPNQVETYIHRIGRTARAGRGGKSCTLIGEGRRHLMKEIIKDASDRRKISDGAASASRTQAAVIRSRSIPAAVIAHFVNKIQSLEEHVQEVLQAEAVARMDRLAEMEATRAQNIIEHSDEIKSRPQRQWFASEKEKKMTKEAAAEKARLIKEKEGTGTHRMTRKKRRAREAMEMLEGDNGGDDGAPAVPKLPSMKKAAREHKRELQEKENAKLSKSIHDEDVERAARKRKGRVGQDSLGDSSLFSEEKIAYAPKKKKGSDDERAQSSFSFRGYDPLKDGKKKGKGKSHHKFKSKSKYKRR
jgi:ATP-dependent RNA helicase DDX27